MMEVHHVMIMVLPMRISCISNQNEMCIAAQDAGLGALHFNIHMLLFATADLAGLAGCHTRGKTQSRRSLSSHGDAWEGARGDAGTRQLRPSQQPYQR